MTAAPTPHHAALEALVLHGALLPAELRDLGVTEQDAADLGMTPLDTVIGRLHFPLDRRVKFPDGAWRVTGRTVAAATDGAYLRLFMRSGALPGRWDVPQPGALGLLKEDLTLLPSIQLGAERHRACGKVLGNGMHPRTLKIYLQVHGLTLHRAREKLLIIGPTISRYDAVAKSFAHVLSLREFTALDAQRANT